MTEMNVAFEESEELVGATGLACTIACGSICALTMASGGMFYASVATIL